MAAASTVAPMDVRAMADYSGQVIVGTAGPVRSYWTGTPPRIESQVQFDDVVYLKGAPPATAAGTFILTVPGGTVGSTQFRVAGACSFNPGERWLLFLLPTYRTFPVVGLWEGAFRVATDETGTPRVFNAVGAAVTGIDPDGFVQDGTNSTVDARHRCVGSDQAELLISGTPASAITPISLEEFVELLQPHLAASRQHSQNLPPGRPEPVVHTPVPLKAATNKDVHPGTAGLRAFPLRRFIAPEAGKGQRPESRPANSSGGR